MFRFSGTPLDCSFVFFLSSADLGGMRSSRRRGGGKVESVLLLSRSAVLQMHTAIEDLLNSFIVCRILNVTSEHRARRMSTKTAKALQSMLIGPRSMGFEMKLNFAFVLGLLNCKTKDRLAELNTLRNRCSHNWLLKAPLRRGKGPKQKKPPLLRYDRRDLHNVEVVEDFISEYGIIYAKLFAKYVG